MSRRGTGAGALALVGLMVLATTGQGPAGYWAPDGFVDRADRLIAEGGLELRCGVQDSIMPALEPETADERFFRSSYLRADVRRFNEDPAAARSPFLVEGCTLLGVDPFYHRVDLPYNRVPRWRGTVRFARAENSATLVGGRDQRLQVVHPLEGALVAPSERIDPSRGGATAHTEFLRLEVPGTQEVAAEAFFVGGDPVLADRRDVSSRYALRLDGFRLPPGRLVRVETGDWVQLRAGERVFTYVVQGSDQAEVVSAAGSDVRSEDRRYLIPRMAPFVGRMAQAFEAGLQSTPSARDDGTISRLDVRLTLDRELETASQEIVSDWCVEQSLPDRPRTASLLIMDAFSGDVLAMPTCPGERELEDYGQLSRRLRSRYLVNQNLVSRPVGSALKPFWAAAVATAFPRMLDLEIPAHQPGDVNDVLGCPVTPPYGSVGHEGWEGLESFIPTSCNRYMVEMASAALIAGAGPGVCVGEAADMNTCLASGSDTSVATTVRFCDELVSLVLEGGRPFTGDRCDDLRLVGSDFAPALPLEGLTGAAAYRDRAPVAGSGLDEGYRAGRYRLDLWRQPIEALRAAGDTANPVVTALRFTGVSPEVTNLALNTVEELRTDWVNLLLGGENSRWSNFQLAEATARLVTGRDVRGRLVSEVGHLDPGESGRLDAGEAGAAEPLGASILHPGARRRVLHAMELVTGPGGTGARLAAPLAALMEAVRGLPGGSGYEVLAFAKTGTPAVSVPAGDRMVDREGSVLILGLLIVPPSAGRKASRQEPDWVSACILDPGLRTRILGVPPALLLDGEKSMGVTMSVYLDDLDRDASEATAAMVAAEILGPLSGYLTSRLERRLREQGWVP